MRKGANKFTAYTYITDTEKQCSKCRVIKPHSEFHVDRSNKRGFGLGYYCKVCTNMASRVNHHRRKTTDPEFGIKRRSQYTRRVYGITSQQYDQLLRDQKSKCAICDIDLVAGTHLCHYDHDHITGNFRGFLCSNCNRGLGHFQESSKNLQAAIAYLEKYK